MHYEVTVVMRVHHIFTACCSANAVTFFVHYFMQLQYNFYVFVHVIKNKSSNSLGCGNLGGS